MLSAKLLSKSVLVTVAGLPLWAHAGTVNLNFASLSQPGDSYAAVAPSLTQDGFTIAGTQLYVWEASSPNLPSLNPADTSLFDFYAGAPDKITDAGNAAFTMNSIELAPLIVGGTGTFNVTFTGFLADGLTVSQTLTVNDAPDALQLFDLTGFADVVGVSFAQGSNFGFFGSQDTAYQFDDISLTTNSTTTPEPGSLLLLASGIVALGGCKAAGVRRPRFVSVVGGTRGSSTFLAGLAGIGRQRTSQRV
jgi:hypothetical protein